MVRARPAAASVRAILAHLPTRGLAALLALLATLAVVGCGGGGSDGSMSQDEVVARVEAACTKAAGYNVWLPEHLHKTNQSIAEAGAIIRRVGDRFRASLEALDPPDELRGPIERLTGEASTGSASSLAAIRTRLKRQIALYEEVGATRCAKSVEASLLSADGKSVEDAYRSVGLPLPPRPAGW